LAFTTYNEPPRETHRSSVSGRPTKNPESTNEVISATRPSSIRSTSIASASKSVSPGATVLTLTLTGIAADSRIVGGTGGHPARRLIAVTAMFTGALLGALLVIHFDLVLPLAIAAALIAICVLAAHTLSRDHPN
jgi:Protein of unknown function (DUF1275)